MAKKAPAKPAAKRKPRVKKPVQPDLPDGKYNAVVWNPELETYVVTPLPRDRKKSVIDQSIEEAETHLLKPAAKSSSLWRRLMLVGAVVAGLAVSFGGGVWSAGGINVGPKPIVFADTLAESHKNDRVSQIRILREYAAKTFSSDPEAQKWLNEQRVAARPDDWGPYTDELGRKADEGPEAVKAFADALEGK